jgi:hypothetical protein
MLYRIIAPGVFGIDQHRGIQALHMVVEIGMTL